MIDRVGLPAVGDGRVHRVGMPPPDANRPVDILDINLAAVLEANVDPIANTFVDDRGDANAAGLGDRFKARGDVHAIAVNVIALDDHIAQIDANAENNLLLAFIPQFARPLDRKCAVDGIDYASELNDGAIANQLDDAALVGGDRRLKDRLPVLLQGSERARLVGRHQSGIADDVGREDGCQFPVDAFFGHESSAGLSPQDRTWPYVMSLCGESTRFRPW